MANNVARFWRLFDHLVELNIIQFIDIPVHRHRSGDEEDLRFGSVHVHISAAAETEGLCVRIKTIAGWTDSPTRVFRWIPDFSCRFQDDLSTYLRALVICFAFVEVCNFKSRYTFEFILTDDEILVTFSPLHFGIKLFCDIRVGFVSTLAFVVFRERFWVSHSVNRPDDDRTVYLSNMGALVDFLRVQLRNPWARLLRPMV